MDLQNVINMALELVLERVRQKKMLMEESLRAQQVALQKKVMECSMLTKLKQGLLAKEAASKKLVDDFMDFIGAIENNEVEMAQNFDEKAMMNTIETMIDSNSGTMEDFPANTEKTFPKSLWILKKLLRWVQLELWITVKEVVAATIDDFSGITVKTPSNKISALETGPILTN
ncbi:hypothetical protein REPUB_Repub16aG0097000 [Reevesia pubescens]